MYVCCYSCSRRPAKTFPGRRSGWRAGIRPRFAHLFPAKILCIFLFLATRAGELNQKLRNHVLNTHSRGIKKCIHGRVRQTTRVLGFNCFAARESFPVVISLAPATAHTTLYTYACTHTFSRSLSRSLFLALSFSLSLYLSHIFNFIFMIILLSLSRAL